MTGISNGVNGNLVGSALAPIDPELAPAGGSPTPTLLPLASSPAIAAGMLTGGTPPLDQRGYPRPTDGHVDIGADQRQYDLQLTGDLPTVTFFGGADSEVQYAFTLTNNGHDAADNATVTVPLPAGSLFESATMPAGWTLTDPGVLLSGTVSFTDTAAFGPSAGAASFEIKTEQRGGTPGTATITTATVTPSNSDINPPAESSSLAFFNAAEGQTYRNVNLFHFSDPNPLANVSTLNAAVDWGDGITDTTIGGDGSISVVADPAGGFDVLGSHAYAEEGDYGIKLEVEAVYDATDLKVSVPQTAFLVQDAPLTALALTPPAHAAVSQPISNATLLHFSDADPGAAVGNYTAFIYWGDAIVDSVTSTASPAGQIVPDPSGSGFDVIGSHTYTQMINPGTFEVRVTDAGGALTQASDNQFQVLSADAPLTAGSLTVPSVTTEGQSVKNMVLFRFSDTDHGAVASDYRAVVAWGDGTFSSSDDGSGKVSVVAATGGGFHVVGSHVYTAGSGYFGVNVTDLGDSRATPGDLGGQVALATSAAPLKVSDRMVIVAAGPKFTAMKDIASVRTVASFTDPGGPVDLTQALPYVAGVNWGDGTFSSATSTGSVEESAGVVLASSQTPGIVLVNGRFEVVLSHAYAEAGTYTITTSVEHGGELSASVSTTAVVRPSVVQAAPGQVFSAKANLPSDVQTVATFTDPAGPETDAQNNPYVATVVWGDGTTSTATLANGGIILGSDGKTFAINLAHEYAKLGSHTITIRVNHEGMVSAPVTTAASVSPGLTLKRGGYIYDATNQEFAQTVTITNASGGTVSGSLALALTKLSSDATLANSSGTDANADPYVVFLSPGQSLAAGQSITVTLYFKDPTLQAISYGTSIEQGL